ncbi:MAG: hypothetical protein GC160_01280 [Acidobacteria bacterium]|nr:hypothetical protein [Acidobacteriota bacterium]
MRTSNPALNENTFRQVVTRSGFDVERMTLDGTVNRTGMLLLLAVVAALYPWSLVQQGENTALYWMGGAIGGLIFGLITSFKPAWSPITAPIYAVLEGLFLGAISGLFEMRYPGIAIQAVGLTLGTAGALLLAYRSRLIKVTENFRLGVVAATGGICLFYLASWVLGFFGIQIPLIHGSGLVGIGFSLIVVGVAALNLVLDFDFIENGVAAGVPKYMEWYGAFGLMVTLVWLYVEFLRLLSKLRDR